MSCRVWLNNFSILVTLEKQKKSENTRLQQSWNHNGNSRNTQEVFCLDNVIRHLEFL